MRLTSAEITGPWSTDPHLDRTSSGTPTSAPRTGHSPPTMFHVEHAGHSSRPYSGHDGLTPTQTPHHPPTQMVDISCWRHTPERRRGTVRLSVRRQAPSSTDPDQSPHRRRTPAVDTRQATHAPTSMFHVEHAGHLSSLTRPRSTAPTRTAAILEPAGRTSCWRHTPTTVHLEPCGSRIASHVQHRLFSPVDTSSGTPTVEPRAADMRSDDGVPPGDGAGRHNGAGP